MEKKLQINCPLHQLIAGVDEVGRGPLAGPVVAAAVVWAPDKKMVVGVKDSKKLTAKKRDELYEMITAEALAYAVGRAEVEEIDEINILQASLLAMQRAVEGLSMQPGNVLVDGNFCPKINFSCNIKAIIHGDSIEPLIGAASIVAKVVRDREMVELDAKYPQYGFAKHKGYGTREHLAALAEFGPCSIHRRSFAPVRELVGK